LAIQPFVCLGLLYKLSAANPLLCSCFPLNHAQVSEILLHTVHPSHSWSTLLHFPFRLYKHYYFYNFFISFP
jgi:hypothetical protein